MEWIFKLRVSCTFNPAVRTRLEEMTVVLSLFLPQWLPRLFNISTTHEQVDIKALTYRWILTWIERVRSDESYMRA